MAVGTTITKQLWVELIAGETLAHRDPNPYTWVTVTKTLPETLEVHEGHKIALSSPTNTGVPGADTTDGIFPIYVRYVATTMIGTNVDGSHYDDPGIPWVNYFNGGDAVHGYIPPRLRLPPVERLRRAADRDRAEGLRDAAGRGSGHRVVRARRSSPASPACGGRLSSPASPAAGRRRLARGCWGVGALDLGRGAVAWRLCGRR